MTRAALALVASLSCFPAAARPRPFHQMSSAAADRILRSLHRQYPGFLRRFLAISARFLGTPYRFSPLGEGGQGRFDRDPLFDLRHVDCLTLVEQTLAMAHAPDLARARRLLQRIRYEQGQTAYQRRHHFTTSQWLPHNQRLGVVRDITAEVGGYAVVTLHLDLDRDLWARRRWRRWRRRLGEALPRGRFLLPVLPLDAAIRRAGRFPAGAVVSVVRRLRPGDADPVSHQGIVVVRRGRRYLRHASSGPRFRRVVDYPLGAYLRFSRRYFARRARPVLGVNVQLPQESAALLRWEIRQGGEPERGGPGRRPRRTGNRSSRPAADPPRAG